MRYNIFCVVLSAVIGIVAGGALKPAHYTFEVELFSSVASEARLYYDFGDGLSEAHASGQRVLAGHNRVQLPLPLGEIRGLRFDPINVEGEVTVGAAQVTRSDGSVVKRFPTAALLPVYQLRDIELTAETRRLVTTPGAFDAQIAVELGAPLRLGSSFFVQLVAARWRVFGWWSISWAALWLLRFVWRRQKRWWRPIGQGLRSHPQLTLAACSAAAAMAASYPVVFLGGSYNAPNTGIRLLYDGTITVPKQQDARLSSGRGSDIGAFHWAHQPYTVLQKRALQEGVLPLWNRYNSCGVTLLGQGQSMFGDPLNFLVMLAGGDALAFDVKYVLCKGLFAFGIALAVWLLTRDLAAAALITFGAAFVAFFNYRVNHPAIFSMSYSPWVLVAWLKLLGASSGRELSRSLALWFVVNWTLLASGTIKEAYLLCTALNATGGLMLLLSPVPAQVKLHRLIPIGIAGVALVLATVPFWWTFLDALHGAQTFYDLPAANQAPRGWLIGLFDDAFYMEVLPGRALYIPGSNFLILLGCAWALVSFRHLGADRFALALLAGLVAAISVGFAWVPAQWIVAIPFLRNLHHPGNHFSCIAIVHAAVLAGWGFSAVRQSVSAGRRRVPQVAGVLLLVGVLLAAYFFTNPTVWTGGRGFAGWMGVRAQHELFYGYVLLLLVSLGVFMFVVLVHPRGKPLTPVAAALGVLALVGLLGRHASHAHIFPPSQLIYTPGTRSELFTPSPVTQFLRQATARDPARVIGTGNAMFPGFPAVYGLEGHNGPDALFSPYYRKFLVCAQLVPTPDWHSTMQPADLPSWRPFLDFLNVGYIAATPNSVPDESNFRRVAQLDLDVLHGETTWPRAFFIDRLDHYEKIEDLVSRVRQQPAGQPFAMVQVGDVDVPPAAVQSADRAIVTRASGYELSTNTTAFTIQAPRAGFAILHESWLKDDFRATANGVSVPYFRVNHVFKAIALPHAGTYRVAFEYWPRHFTRSLVLGALGLVLFAGLLTALHRSRAMTAVFERRQAPVPGA